MAINAAKLVTMHDDAELREIVDGCDLVNADGQSVVWASRLLGDPLPERVAGIDLMARAARPRRASAATASTSSAPARRCSRRAVERIREQHPRLAIAGYRDGYFTDDESAEVCAAIRGSRADLLFVAMSEPAQGVLPRRARAEPRRRRS